MNFKQVEKIILDDGWYQIISNSGSHRQYKHPTKKGKVTIAYHGNKKELSEKTVKSIMVQAEVKFIILLVLNLPKREGQWEFIML